MALAQVNSLVKAFSSFKPDDGLSLLGVKGVMNEDDEEFVEEPLKGEQPLLPLLQTTLSLKTVSDLMDHLGKDLALRFLESDAAEGGKEAVRRELISPLIFTACALVEGVKVLAEHTVSGVQARGSIDWALLFCHFSIVVIEASVFTFICLQDPSLSLPSRLISRMLLQS